MNCWRNTSLRTLPEGVLGKLVTISSRSGSFCRATSAALTCSARASRPSRQPALSTTQGAGRFAEARMRHGDHHNLGDGRMPIKNVFDFLGADLFAAAVDEVLLAVGDLQGAVGSRAADVAVLKNPSSSKMSAVCCRSRYPRSIAGPRAQISPSTPWPTIRPSSSTIRTS